MSFPAATPVSLACVSIISWLLFSCAVDNGNDGAVKPSGALKQGPDTTSRHDHPARLQARPFTNVAGKFPSGLRRFRLEPQRESYLFVPPNIGSRRPAPFLMTLHGAGGNSSGALRLFKRAAISTGAVLFAPQSTGPTWDLMAGGYGPDVAYIDNALKFIFKRYAIDPSLVTVGGFSDGASYALSLSISNGDLFKRVIALSPGFVAPGPPHGRPRIFIAHGRRDTVLPYESTAKEIVSTLADAGYDVTVRIHSGGHVPGPRLSAAAHWFAEQK